jgi:hypothetical protein
MDWVNLIAVQLGTVATRLSASSNATDANGFCAPSRRGPPTYAATAPATPLSAFFLVKIGFS